MRITGGRINPFEGFANPPSFTFIADEYPEPVSKDVYNVEHDSGRNVFVVVNTYDLGFVSVCTYPIPSCFSETTNWHMGAGRDNEFGLVDGWYDSGSTAIKFGIIEDMVEIAVSKDPRGGGVAYMAPASLVRETMEKYTPEWKLGDPVDGSYYYSIRRKGGE